MSDEFLIQLSQCWLDYIKENKLSGLPIDEFIIARKDFYSYVEQQYGINVMPYIDTSNNKRYNYVIVHPNKKLLFDLKYPQ